MPFKKIWKFKSPTLWTFFTLQAEVNISVRKAGDTIGWRFSNTRMLKPSSAPCLTHTSDVWKTELLLNGFGIEVEIAALHFQVCVNKKTVSNFHPTKDLGQTWIPCHFPLGLQALWGKKSFQCMQGLDVIQGASPKSGIQIIGSLGGQETQGGEGPKKMKLKKMIAKNNTWTAPFSSTRTYSYLFSGLQKPSGCLWVLW